MVLAVPLTVSGQNPPCVPPPPGLVAWWPLDEAAGATNAQDIAPAPFSWVNDKGTMLPGPVNSTGPMAVAPKVGSGALYFFGPYIEVPHSVDLAFAGSFSIDAWIQVVDCGHAGGGTYATVVDKWDPATQTGVSFFVDQPTPATGWLKLQWNSVVFTSTNSFPTATNPTNLGPWIHVAVTVDQANQVGTFYINGAVAGTFTPPASGVMNAVPLWIGLGRVSPSMCELAIDELELFDRALTAQEVLQLYAADAAGKCRPGASPDVQICVEKFLDSNANGIQDPNEPLLAGWQFVVLDAASNVVGILTSAPLGTPPGCLTLPAGTYVVMEVLQPGWTNTTPVSQTVTLQSGQSTNLLFGNIGCLLPPPGMVGWWPLDDATNQTTVLDLAAGNHGTPKNSAGVTIPVGIPTLWQLPDPGVFGGSLLPVVVDPSTSPPRGAFFFSDTYVEVPHHPSLNIGPNGLTLTLWVWPTMGSGGPQPLVEKFDLATMNGYSLYLQPVAANTFVLTMNLNGTVVTGPQITTSMTPSDWHFVVARVNAAGQVILGACDMLNNCTNTVAVSVPNFLTTNAAPLWLSRSGVASATGVDVQAIRVGMDEVEIFGRALSLAELQAIYAAELAGMRKCPPQAGVTELCIVKFHDLDGDGVQDPGEPGLSGWPFLVNPPPLGLGTNVVTTGPGGTICVPVSAPGTYTISETLLAGWTNTTASTQTVAVTVGQPANVVFGNTQIPTGLTELCIVKFEDLNGNGAQDPGEPGLSGWSFMINPPPLGLGTNVVTTGPGGTICVPVSAPGTYTITETLQSGWTNTTPTNQVVSVVPNQLATVWFGNALVSGPARICVFKYHDLNKNGIQDPGEPVLAGWTILVKDNLGNTIHTVTTSTNAVCVSVPAPGLYHVSEVLPPPIGPWLPWSPTGPPSGTYSNVNVAPGQTVILAFGNRKNIKIVGTGLGSGPLSPLRLVIRMTAEPGQWYQLQYRESLDADAPWRDWGEPVQATEPEVTFEVPVEARQRQLYLRGIEKKDIRR